MPRVQGAWTMPIDLRCMVASLGAFRAASRSGEGVTIAAKKNGPTRAHESAGAPRVGRGAAESVARTLCVPTPRLQRTLPETRVGYVEHPAERGVGAGNGHGAYDDNLRAAALASRALP